MIDAIDLSMQEPEVEPYRQYYFIKKCRQMIAQLTDKLGQGQPPMWWPLAVGDEFKRFWKIGGHIGRYWLYLCRQRRCRPYPFNTLYSARKMTMISLYGRLGQLKRYKEKNPDMLIGICGCRMQEVEEVERIKRATAMSILSLEPTISISLQRF